MIIGEIRRYLRDNNFIRVSRSLRDTAYHALQIKEQLTKANSKEPTIEEIAKIMEVPAEDITTCLLYTSLLNGIFHILYEDGILYYSHNAGFPRQWLMPE